MNACALVPIWVHSEQHGAVLCDFAESAVLKRVRFGTVRTVMLALVWHSARFGTVRKAVCTLVWYSACSAGGN